MKNKSLFLILAFSCFVLFCRAQTYTMPPDSFKKQFMDIDSGKMTVAKAVNVAPFGRGGGYYYKINGIKKVNCYTKTGDPYELEIWPAIETQLTYGYLNKKTTLFFDRMYERNNNVLVGPENKVLWLVMKAIPFDSITKVELFWGKQKDVPMGSGVFRKVRYAK